MIKGSAEFYRHFPNFKKGEDGKYHIHHINNRESDWGGSDSPYEVSSMHTIFPLAMRASEIIAVDEDLRPIWREIKENLVPIPERGRRRGSGAYGAKQAEALNGHLLKFSTRKGEHIVLV
jgi:hypothetical protein